MLVHHSVQHAVIGGHNVLNSGQAANLRQHVFQTHDLASGICVGIFAVPLRRLWQVKGQKMVAAETGILMQQMSERLHHEGRANQQNESQGHFHDNERAAKS